MTNGSNPEAIRLASLEADDQFECYERRRFKAAVALTGVWGCMALLHLLTWGQWIVYGLTALTGAHLFRLLLAQPAPMPEPLPSWRSPAVAPRHHDPAEWPYVSILVAAKNEVTVIGSLAESLMGLDYPPERYDVWLIDDNSTDGTGELMDQLAQKYVNLHAVHRDQAATGGKSGALNQVWRKTLGSFLVVFDADAQITPDCLRRVVPLFADSQVGAVQMRKAIANGGQNFWTRGQVAEMAFDAYCQVKRVAQGGLGELRGNGQFVRRSALEQCGGWTEETITDDLDLTFKLHLMGWDIPLVMVPAVWEEGVVKAISLWHQRNRWAEGGYQRYLDYWRLLTPQRLGWLKMTDLLFFCLIQYILPTAAIPDFVLAVARHRMPILWPLSSLVLAFSTLGMVNGLWRTQKVAPWVVLMQSLRGTVYMMHWFLVMGTVTFRMAIRPKKLKWVKTQHAGIDDHPIVEATMSSQ